MPILGTTQKENARELLKIVDHARRVFFEISSDQFREAIEDTDFSVIEDEFKNIPKPEGNMYLVNFLNCLGECNVPAFNNNISNSLIAEWTPWDINLYIGGTIGRPQKTADFKGTLTAPFSVISMMISRIDITKVKVVVPDWLYSTMSKREIDLFVKICPYFAQSYLELMYLLHHNIIVIQNDRATQIDTARVVKNRYSRSRIILN